MADQLFTYEVIHLVWKLGMAQMPDVRLWILSGLAYRLQLPNGQFAKRFKSDSGCCQQTICLL